MPSFYHGGPDNILGGNEEQQIIALRDYILSLVERWTGSKPSDDRRSGQ